MNILKSKNFVNEKLNIKPVTKTLLTAIKDGKKGIKIYQDRWGQAFISEAPLESKKLTHIDTKYSLSDVDDFLDNELEPTSKLYSAAMIQTLLDYFGFENIDDMIDAKIGIFDPDTINDTNTKYIETATDCVRWILKH